MGTNSVAAMVREKVLGSRDRFWRPDDFEGSPEAVSKALARLEKAGEVRRIRRGLYWRGASTPLGMAPPPNSRLAEEIAREPGSGPAGLSAALALGLSTQVPRHDVIAVASRAPRDMGTVRFVSRSAGTRRRDARLRPPEVALLEVLRDWDRLVGVSLQEALDLVESLVSDGILRLDSLVRASVTEPPRTRDRLRSLLEALNRGAEAARVRPSRSGGTPPWTGLSRVLPSEGRRTDNPGVRSREGSSR